MARKISAGSAGGAALAGFQAFTTTLTSASNTDIVVDPTGTGRFLIDGNAQLQAQSDLRFADASSSNFVALQAPATISSNYTLTLPATDGTNNQVLTTNGSGTLAWTTKEIAVTNDTTGSAQFNIALTSASSGNITGITTTNTKLQFQPSTGLLTTSTLTVNGTARSLLLENVQTASYTFVLTDQNRVVAMTNTSDATLTIPNDSAVNFPVGSVLYAVRVGSASTTLAVAGGVSATRTGQFAANEEIYIRKRSANNWIVVDQPRTLSATGGAISSAAGYTVHSFTSGSSTLVIS